jgi:putative oxidoreductase
LAHQAFCWPERGSSAWGTVVTNPVATYPTLLKLFDGQDMTRLRDLLIDPLGRSPISLWAPIPLRLIVGFGFLQHGFAKLSRGPDAFAAILQDLAVPAPHFMAWVNILTELLGGLAILLGAFIVLASVPMAILLLTAIVTVHWPYGFSSIKLIAVTAAGPQFGTPGYEVDLLYLACLAALVVGGSGPLSIDGIINKRRRSGHS